MSFGGILRQSTAVDVLIGPFVDSTDGDAEETGLTIAQAAVLLSKNGQTAAQKNDATTCAHDADGFYNCELDATDTNTVGQLVLYVHVAGALAVRHDFQVVEEAVYDALYAASAVGPLLANSTGSGLTTLATAANLATAKTVVDAIKLKTDNLPADPADASDIAAAIAALNDLSEAEVKAQVVAALDTDTYAEPTGVPAATVALTDKISFLYMALRNGLTVTSTKKTFLDDGGAAEWEKDLSDDGSTYSETKGNAI